MLHRTFPGSLLRTHGLALAAIATTAGCNAPTATAPDGGAADLAQVPMCKPDGTRATFAARYGLSASLRVNVKIPPDCESEGCILDENTASSLLFMADVKQTGQDLEVTPIPCRFKIPEVKLRGQDMPIVLTASDALVQSVKVARTTARIDGPDVCAHFDLTPFALVVGARLADPVKDPLPAYDSRKQPPVNLCGGMASVDCDAAMDHGCVCDQDKDGKPGATVGARNLPALTDVDQMYLSLRAVVGLSATVWPALPGQAMAGPRLRGDVVGFRLDQNPVGCRQMPQGGAPADCNPSATRSVVALNPKVTQAQGPTMASTFLAVPVPEATTCADLIAQAGQLFKEN